MLQFLKRQTWLIGLLGVLVLVNAFISTAFAISEAEALNAGEQTGYSIGYDQGRQDRDNDNRFNDDLRGQRDTEGYTNRLKHKDNYKRGFRMGYQNGYRSGYYSGGSHRRYRDRYNNNDDSYNRRRYNY